MTERRDDTPKDTMHLLISGEVQGVAYRAWAEREANRHGVHGWIRNLTDGRVEAVVSGPAGAVEAMAAACHEGPPDADVEAVDVKRLERPASPGFQVLPDA